MEKRKNYPPQTGRYKVNINNKTANWQEFSTARLQVSMDNEKQTGEKLKTLVDWSCAGRFSKVIIIVSDTLNWFNIAFQNQISEKDALKIALKSGDDWINANPFLKEYNIEIKRWNEWYKNEEYYERLYAISSIYKENEEFRKMVSEVSQRIWDAKSNSSVYNSEKNFNDYIKTSEAYILSELSVFSIMFNEANAIEIYPGSWLKDIFEIICDYSHIYPYLECFRNKAYLHVEFTRNKKYQQNLNRIETQFS